MAVNVVYFLEPLESYVKEFHRIIKQGGEGIIACKFNGVANFDDSVAVNKDIDFVTSSFEEGGSQRAVLKWTWEIISQNIRQFLLKKDPTDLSDQLYKSFFLFQI